MKIWDEISKIAGLTPELPALTDNDGERTISYKEFDILSGRAASKLLKKGVKKDDCVVIQMDRCIEYIVSELAILKAGCVIVPLIPGYPKERVDYIVKDCNAALIIDEAFFEDIDRYDELTDDERLSNDRTFIIYTSGSTGNPKGVVYTLESVVAQITRSYKCVQDIKPLIYAASATMSFCVTINEYLRLLTLGAHIHILSERVRSDVKLIEDYYENHHITCGFLSPRIAKLYKNKDKDLKRLFTASEKVVNLYAEGYEIYNTYGQTETIGTITEFIIDRAYDNTPIGKPLEGISLHVFDEDGNEVPEGQEGEIIIEGILPCEYNNLPEQTTHTFKRLPNGNVQVRTGDIGKMLPDGNMLYLNRNDWMIKIHGQRVEPGEIEAVMNKADGVTGSIVKAYESEDGSMLLCGFYTTGVSKNTDNTSQEQSDVSDQDDIKSRIIEKLESRLPHYMIPNVLIRMDEFPVNANGKIDRKSIQRPDVSILLTQYEKPVGKVEEALCSVMAKILGCEKIGRNDNFYELGGNSINAIELSSECGIEGLAPQFILMGRTPKGIAEIYLKNADSIKPSIKKSQICKKQYPMSLAQRYQLNVCESAGVNIDIIDVQLYYELSNEIDEQRLENAVCDFVKDHPIYNSQVDKINKQVIFNDDAFRVRHVDISAQDFEAHRAKKYEKPRDLLKDPLFLVELIHTDDGKRYICFIICHLLYDLVTWVNLLKVIPEYYDGKRDVYEDSSYTDLIEYEELVSKTPFFKKAESFYDDFYSDVKSADLFGKEEYSSAIHQRILEDIPKSEMLEFAADSNVSVLTVFQCALEFSVRIMYGKDDFTYMNVYDGRTDESLRDTFGVLAKSVYMKTGVPKSDSVREHLKEIRDMYQKLVYYDVIDIPKLIEKHPDIDSGITFNFRNALVFSMTLDGHKLKFPFPEELSKYSKPFTPLNFMTGETRDDGYEIIISATKLSMEEAAKLAEIYDAVLHKMLKTDSVNEIMELRK